ncbi:MAG: guanylate cyclase [Nitrospirae bacterium]|nr:guanylate cyclase [Nitrospirota bacterium]
MDNDSVENAEYHNGKAVLNLWLGIASLIAVPFFLLLACLRFLESILPLNIFVSLIKLRETLSSLSPSGISFDLILWASVILLVALFLFFNSKMRHHSNMALRSSVSRDFEELKEKTHLSETSKVLSPLKERLDESAGKGGKVHRDELLKIFAETKKKLDTMGRDLAFLSIDIMDSTGMKQGEEKAAIEHDFKEYKQMVEEIIKRNDVMKSAWTPDGVMICFDDTDKAVNAAKEVLRSLDNFNRNVKMIKRDFRVRCGINSGFVYCDDSTPMEEMSDRVIDIAGHMQKYAEGNSVYMSKTVLWLLQDRSGFEPAGKEVDGLEAFAWKG